MTLLGSGGPHRTPPATDPGTSPSASADDDRARLEEIRTARRRARVDFVDVLIVATGFGCGQLRPRLPHGLALVDGLFLVCLALGAHRLLKRNFGGMVFRRLVPWLWLLMIATTLSLLGIGLPFWAADTFARVLFAPLTFCAVLALLTGRPATTYRGRMAMIAAAVVATGLALLGGPGDNGRFESGTLLNANYTAHYLATAVILLVGARTIPKPIRLVLAAAFVFTIARTGSFGAVTMLIAASGYVAWRFGARFPQLARVTARVAIVLVLVGMALYGMSKLSSSEFDAGGGLSSQRLDFSAGERKGLWETGRDQFFGHPLGLGPGGFKRRVSVAEGGGIELHSDPLAFLVEHGVLGFIAFLGIAITLWRCAPPGGEARTMLAAFGGACLLRQTFTYRHVWFGLAIVLACDLNTRMAAKREAAP